MPNMGQVDINEYNALRIRVKELEEQVAFLMRHLNLTYTPPDGEFTAKLREMAKQGKLLEAIKLYREKTGASLEEARRYLGG
jgi:ribosomal protein L7/L12